MKFDIPTRIETVWHKSMGQHCVGTIIVCVFHLANFFCAWDIFLLSIVHVWVTSFSFFIALVFITVFDKLWIFYFNMWWDSYKARFFFQNSDALNENLLDVKIISILFLGHVSTSIFHRFSVVYPLKLHVFRTLKAYNNVSNWWTTWLNFNVIMRPLNQFFHLAWRRF